MTIVADWVFPPGQEPKRGTTAAVKAVAREGGGGVIHIPGTNRSVQGRIEQKIDGSTGLVYFHLDPNTGTPANNYYQWITQVHGSPPEVRDFEITEDDPPSSTLTSELTLPVSTVPVANGSVFAAATPETPGIVSIAGQLIVYTGITANNLTGASGGTGLVVNGSAVTQVYWVGTLLVDPPADLGHPHSRQPTDAHDATAVSTAAISGLSGANVQAMLASAQANIASEEVARIDGDLDLLAEVVSEANARIAADTAEALTRLTSDAAMFRAVSGGASTALPANLVLPSDGSTFEIPLVTLTDPASLTESWTVVDPNLIAGNDGDAIQTFTPAKGAAFTQATSAKRPTIRTNVLDGRRVLRADGVDDAMAQAAGTGKAQPNTYLAVARTTDLGFGQRRIFDGLSGSTSHMVRHNAAMWEMAAGATLVGGPTTGAWRAVLVQFNGASSSLGLDGATPVSGDAGTQAPTGVTLFANSAQATQFWSGDLAWFGALASINAALVLGVRRYVQELFPSVPVFPATEWPSAPWYDRGIVRLGPNVVVRYSAKTPNKLTGCTVIVGSGTVVAGTTVEQAYDNEIPAEAVKTAAGVALRGRNAWDKFVAIDEWMRRDVALGLYPYEVGPAQTALYNSEATDQAIQDAANTYGDPGARVWFSKPGVTLVDPTSGSATPGTRKSLTLNRRNIELVIPKGVTVKPPIQTTDQYDVVHFGYGAENCILRVDGQLLGDLRGRTNVANPSGPQTGHTIRVGAAVNCGLVGTGEIAEAWGDGIYIGEEPFDAVYRRPDGFVVGSNLLWRDIRREAIGCFNGDNVVFLGLRVRDVGTLATSQGVAAGPQRGFDAEPNVANPARPEGVRGLTVVWADIQRTYGGGFVVAGGQGAVCDDIQLGIVYVHTAGLTANYTNDWGIHIGDVSRLQAGLLMGENCRYDYGVSFDGDIDGYVQSVISDLNNGGVECLSNGDTTTKRLQIGHMRARNNLRRALYVEPGPGGDVLINSVDFDGNHMSPSPTPLAGGEGPFASTVAELKAASNGKVRIVSGTIRQRAQKFIVTGTPTGGIWTLTHMGQVATIPYNATAAEAQALLEALTTLGRTNVVVEGGVTISGSVPGVAYTVWTRRAGPLTASGAGLTGGSSPGVTTQEATVSYLLDVVSGNRHSLDNVEFDGSGLSATTPVVRDLARGATFRNCPGLRSQNSGLWAIPSGSTFVDVVHGLWRKPLLRDIDARPTNDLGTALKMWIDPAGLTDTHIRIRVDQDPGASGAKGTWAASAERSSPFASPRALGSINNNVDLPSYSVACAIPTANTRIVVFVGSAVGSGDPNQPTLFGLGVSSWTLVAGSRSMSSSRQGMFFEGVTAAPSSGDLTVDFGGQVQTCCEVSVAEYPGVASVGAVAVAVSGGTVTSLSVPITHQADNSATLVAFRVTSNEALVAEAGYSSIASGNHTGPNVGWLVEWSALPDPTPSASWSAAASARGIALELLASTA